MSNKKSEQLSFEEMSFIKKASVGKTDNRSISSGGIVIPIQRKLDKKQKEEDAKIYRSILGRIDHLLK